MPFEIQSGEQLFVRKLVTHSDPWLETHLDVTASPLPVIHNFQHDLESLWWIVLWIVTMRMNHPPSQKHARPIFQNSLIPSPARSAAFKHGLMQMQGILLNQLVPFLDALERVRSSLYGQYWQLGEDKQNEDCSSYSTIHWAFVRFFKILETPGLQLNCKFDQVTSLLILPSQPV